MSLLPSSSSKAPELQDGSPIGEDTLDHDSNDGFDENADDDNLSFDGVYDNEDSYDGDTGYGDELELDYYEVDAAPTGPAPPYYPNTAMCIVCQTRPPYSKGGKSYPTCGFTCAAKLEQALGQVTSGPSSIGRGTTRGRTPPVAGSSSSSSSYGTPRRVYHSSTSPTSPSSNPNMQYLAQYLGTQLPAQPLNQGNHPSPGVYSPQSRSKPSATYGRGGIRHPALRPPQHRQSNGYRGSSTEVALPPPAPVTDPCVVCKTRQCYENYLTCGLKCAEKLAKGGGDPAMCDYCHRRAKLPGHNQCGTTCGTAAKIACLLCKSRPKYKRYHLCGKTCKQLSTKVTPLILEAPEGHATYDLVIKKFESAWKYGTKPTIKKIFKIIESNEFLRPYDRYKKRVGNEVFRYHGTSRKCTLGSNGNTRLCNDSTCALCSILKSSFKTSLANPSGAFGAGVYTSSAANKAYSYSSKGLGAMLLTKVVMGKPHMVNAFGAVSSCPAGYNSVVFDRNSGSLNETIVYSDDAIRPVFLIMFN